MDLFTNWVLGDVSLWYDRWLEEGLSAELILAVHISDIDLRIIRDRLLSILVPSNTNLKDCVAWSSFATSCMRCLAADETVLHCLRDCGATMSIYLEQSRFEQHVWVLVSIIQTDWVMVFSSFSDVHLFPVYFLVDRIRETLSNLGKFMMAMNGSLGTSTT
ncbi:hypothetical protein NC652_029496 [Populus alba x Populus x berolinensis]|nr:hypothetical protein NC652_029496 [Populus alba x Populus x berolinensis]